MDEIYFLLRLLSVPGIGNQRVKQLVKKFEDPGSIFKVSAKEISRRGDLKYNIARRIKKDEYDKTAEKQTNEIRSRDVKVISYLSAQYPESLKRIYNSPVLLYVKGSILKEDENSISIVGMRTPSQYGQKAAEYFSRELSRRGITIISGMARGIDSFAHKGAIRHKGRTIAVLGSGLNVIYPPENRRLYQSIIESGAVVSEFPFNTPPNPENFPKRNRIISGLSKGTLVIEAGEKSGSLITAYLALEQGREVFAVPGLINGIKSRGTHKLIKEGAKLVENIEDILEEIPALSGRVTDDNSMKKIIQDLSENELKLWNILSDIPLHIDNIASTSGMSTSAALSLLLSMELNNSVKQLSGMKFKRN